jgi:AraC-like DNA-binding protein
MLKAADLSLGIEPTPMSATFMQTPLFSGNILVHEVRPGLTITADDITYITAEDISVDMEPALICGILLSGRPEKMLVDGRHVVQKKLNCPVLLGFGKRSNCCRLAGTPGSTSSVGFVLKQAFFDRFAGDVTDDGLLALQKFIQSDFKSKTLTQSPKLMEIAAQTLAHPYNGKLGELFLESNALSFVVEVAKQLDRQNALISALGKRNYDRVMEARDLLDQSIANPPSTLELARLVNVNVTALQANFKAAFDTTIFGYVRDQRLAIARVLLVEHGLAAAEAGRKVGFSSPSAFSAAYRKKFGNPPTAERSQQQK